MLVITQYTLSMAKHSIKAYFLLSSLNLKGLLFLYTPFCPSPNPSPGGFVEEGGY